MVKRDHHGRFLPGSVPNPKGRPKDGESWSAIIRAVGEMYPEDVLAFLGNNNPLGAEFAQLPKSVQMKYLVISRVFAALMFEPTPGLLKELIERLEGKVPDKLEGDLNHIVVFRDETEPNE